MRKLFTMIAIGLLVLGSRAADLDSFLYWMLDPVEDSLAYTYAMICFESPEGERSYLTIQPGDGEEVAPVYQSEHKGTTMAYPVYAQIKVSDLLDMSKDPDNFGFIVELLNEDWNTIGESDWVSYSDIAQSGAIYEDMGTHTKYYAFQAVHAVVPEPTGGLLVLLGVGALALRRKRVA